MGKYLSNKSKTIKLPDDWDDEDDFGFANFDDDFDAYAVNFNKDNKYCSHPSDHRFEKKLLFTLFYLECEFCGYSPDLDGSKEDCYSCHKDYIKWKEERTCRK